jgi:hypothetical protein
MAAETMLRKDLPPKVYFAQFEELVANPHQEAKKIARSLDSRFEGPIPESPGNTSFSGAKRRETTPTEAWICERIASDSMLELGYEPGEGQLRLRDLPDFIQTSAKCAASQTNRLFRNAAARQSIASFVKALVDKQ